MNHQELYDVKTDPGEQNNVVAEHPAIAAAMRTAYDEWWKEVLPCLENEHAIGSKVNPFKERFRKQFGGGPS